MADIGKADLPAVSDPLRPPSRAAGSQASPPSLPTDHQSSAFESENAASDLEGDMDTPQVLEEDVQEAIGVSMSRAQTLMKSPQTPAAEKVAAIQNTGFFDEKDSDYMDDEAKDMEHSLDSDIPELTADGRKPQVQDLEPIERLQHAQAPVSEPADPKSQRSEASRAALQDALGEPRRRSSSGPLSMPDFAGMRRFLPNLPSLPLPKSPGFPTFSFGDKHKDEDGDLNASARKRASSSFTRSALSWANSMRSSSPDKAVPFSRRLLTNQVGPSSTERKDFSTQLRGTHSRQLSEAMSRMDPTLLLLSNDESTRPRSLRRSTSDTSLYMRRSVSKTSTLDDFSKWNNVQDQVNSRFKAITDSFQDSSIRLPSVPKFLRPDAPYTRTNSEVAHRNKMFNSQVGTKILTEGQRAYVASTVQGAVGDRVKSQHPILKDCLSNMTGDLVLLGGYRGSILRSAQPPNRQLWVPVKVGLNLRKVDLEVGLNPEDEENMEDNIIPDGMLSHIGPVDISRRLLKKLRKCEACKQGRLRVHNYGYDWRLSPHLLSQRFEIFLQSLPCNSPKTLAEKRGAMVIAHSLGGLITRHVVNKSPNLFAGVVYAGVPQHCVNILGPLRNGDDVLLSSRVLTAQVNFTLRTSYALLPEDGRCFLNKETREEYPVNFFDIMAWEEYRFSPCIAPPLRSAYQDHRKSLIDTVSGSLPTIPIPHKRMFVINPEDAPRGQPNTPAIGHDGDVGSKAHNAKREVSDFLHTTTRPDHALEPRMSPPSSPARNNSSIANSISTACSIPHDKAVEYLERTLTETLKFKQELSFIASHHESNTYPPASVLYTKSIPTVWGARVSSREAIKTVEAYDDLVFAAGDGVVLARAAMLPKGYMLVNGGLVRSERGHVGLLGDLEGVGTCLRALIDARDKGVGRGLPKEDKSLGSRSPVWDGFKNVLFGQRS